MSGMRLQWLLSSKCQTRRMQAYALCDLTQWSDLDGDGLIRLYDDTVAALLDRL
jgi:hypothetical protein